MIMAGKGRKRVENKLIDNPSSRMVCFSKRRKGLFEKVEELSILSGAKVTALTFSQAGKAYCSDFQTLDSLFCPQVSISSEEDGREYVSTEATAADSLVSPQLGMSAEKEAQKEAEKDTLGSAFSEAVASDSLLCRSFDMSAEQADFAEDMVQELYSSDVPTLNTVLCPELQISSEKEVYLDENFYCSHVATFNPLFYPQFNVFAENEAENCWEFDFSEAMAGKELHFWYNKPNVQAMGCEELLRLERAVLEYRQMQLTKNRYR